MIEFQLTNGITIALALTLTVAIAYLAAQVRQNSRAVRSGNRQACLAFACDVYSEVAKDAQLAALFRSGLNDFSALNSNEKVRLHMFLQSMVILFQDSLNAYNENVISIEEYQSNRAAVTAVLRMPGGRVWWQDAQNAFSIELRNELNTESDANYALGDIYPYFLFEAGEKHQATVVQPSVDKEPSASATFANAYSDAANESIQPKKAVTEVNWRKGLVRRRAR